MASCSGLTRRPATNAGGLRSARTAPLTLRRSPTGSPTSVSTPKASSPSTRRLGRCCGTATPAANRSGQRWSPRVSPTSAPPPDGGGGHLYAFDADDGRAAVDARPTAVYPDGARRGRLLRCRSRHRQRLRHRRRNRALASRTRRVSSCNVAIANDVLYAAQPDDPIERAVFALDAATGEQLWSFTVDGGILGGIAVGGGRAFVDTSSTASTPSAAPTRRGCSRRCRLQARRTRQQSRRVDLPRRG